MEKTITRIANFNSVILTGAVGGDNSIFRNQKGNMVAFSFAHSVGKDADGNEKTVWLDVKAFSTEKRPLDLSIVAKGQKLKIEGRLSVETFTRKDGSAGSKVILIANSIEVNAPVTYQVVDNAEDDLPAAE